MFTLRLLGGASLDGPDGPVAGRAALRQRIALAGPAGGRASPPAQPRQAGRRSLARERHRRRPPPASRVALHPPLGPGRRLGAQHRRRPPAEPRPADLRSLGVRGGARPGRPRAAVGRVPRPVPQRLPSLGRGGVRALGGWRAVAPGPPVRPGAASSWRSGRCGAATRCGRSSGGRAWRARIPTTPGSRCGTCRPSRRPATGPERSDTRARTPSCCAADLDAAPGARGGRAGGTAQARVARRLERRAGRSTDARRLRSADR